MASARRITMPKDPKPRKVKVQTFYTRAKSIKLLNQGADPNEKFFDEKNKEQGRFLNHPNVHVRQVCWKKMGRPLSDDADERAKFLASIRVKEKVAETVEVAAVDVGAVEPVIVN